MNEDRSNYSQRLNQIIADYLEAAEAGTAPDRDELVAAHPDLADDLRSFFTEHDRMKAAAGSANEEATLPPSESVREDATLPPSDAGAAATEDDTIPPSQPDSESATIPPSPSQAAFVGSKVRYFGDYELIDEIARGGMGVVFKAKQRSLNRTVALKMILAGQLASEEDVQRFCTEAEAAANLDHPGIVPIYEVGQHEGQHYFSMGFVEGSSLSAKIADGPLTAGEAAQLVKTVAEAVQYAHQKGVIHRDLKPANILLDEKEQPRVTDFGLAKRVSGESDLTDTGQVLGTPSYMPPEQAAGRLDQIGPATDVYALGAILYTLITGRPPFQAASPIDTLMQVLDQEPAAPSILNPRIRRDLETIALKCLEKDPRRRYAAAQELADELQRFLNGEPIVARPIGRVARTWRWCKRKPIVASLAGAAAAMLLILFATITIAYYRVAAAEKETTARLRDSLLHQATAHLQSSQSGHRMLAQEALIEAASIRPGLDLRNEYLASMDLVDLTPSHHLVQLNETQMNAASSRVRPFAGPAAFDPSRNRLLVLTSGIPVHYDPSTGNILDIRDAFESSKHLYDVSPSGKLACFAMDDDSIAIWDIESGTLRAELLDSDGKPIGALVGRFSPDEKAVALASDRIIYIYDLESKRLSQQWDPEAEGIDCIAWSPSGDTLAASGRQSGSVNVCLWSVSRNQHLGHLGLHRFEISPGGLRLESFRRLDFCQTTSVWLAALGTDGNLKVWRTSPSVPESRIQARDFKLRYSVRAHEANGYHFVRFSKNGRWLATRGWGREKERFRIWSVASGRLGCEARLEYPVCVPNRDEYIDAHGQVWQIKQPVFYEYALPRPRSPPVPVALTFSRSGKYLAAAGRFTHKSDTLLVRLDESSPVSQWLQGGASSYVFSPDEGQLWSSRVSESFLWQIPNAATDKKRIDDRVEAIGFDAAGNRLAVVTRPGFRLSAFGLASRKRLWTTTWPQKTPKGSLTAVEQSLLSISDNGEQLVCSEPATVRCWNTGDGKRTLEQTMPPGNIAFFQENHLIRLNLTTLASVPFGSESQGEPLRTDPGNYGTELGGFLGIRISPNGLLCAVSKPDGSVLIWNLRTRQKVAIQRGQPMRSPHPFYDRQVFSADGRYFAARDGVHIKVWDTSSGSLLGQTDNAPLFAFARSDDASRLVTITGNGTVNTWNVNDQQTLPQFQLPVASMRDAEQIVASIEFQKLWKLLSGTVQFGVYAMLVAPSADKLFVLSTTERLAVVDFSSGNEITDLGDMSGGKTIEFDPDGTRVFSSYWTTDQQATEVTVFDLKNKESLFSTRVSGRVSNAAFSKGGQKVAIVIGRASQSEDSKDRIAVYDVWNQKQVESIASDDRLVAVSMDAKGTRLLWATEEDVTLKQVNGDVLFRLTARGYVVSNAVLSPSARWIAIADTDGIVRLYHLDLVRQELEPLSLSW